MHVLQLISFGEFRIRNLLLKFLCGKLLVLPRWPRVPHWHHLPRLAEPVAHVERLQLAYDWLLVVSVDHDLARLVRGSAGVDHGGGLGGGALGRRKSRFFISIKNMFCPKSYFLAFEES